MSALAARAVLLQSQGRHDLAVNAFKEALSQQPDDASLHGLYSLSLSELERSAEATREAEAAVRLAPDRPLGHYALAHALYDRQRHDEAARAAAEAIRLDPNDADYRAILSQVRAGQERWAEARDEAEAGLALDPEHVACANLRAMALVRLGQPADAQAAIEGVLARAPESAITHANQGWALLHQGRREQALEHFREALRINPQQEWARLGLVECLKARFPVYGLLLRYSLWMARLSPRARWAVMIGGYFGVRAAASITSSNPSLAIVTGPLIAIYLLFVLLSWIADPLFTLLLRLNRFGRLVLSREEIVASNWVGGCLLGGLVLAGLAALLQNGGLLMLAGVCAALALPMAVLFQCQPGWPRRVMAGVTGLIALLALVGGGWLTLAAAQARPQPAAGLTLFWIAVVGVFLATLVGNILTNVQPRR